MISLGRKDWKGAVMSFNFARSYEPSSALIAQKAERSAGCSRQTWRSGEHPAQDPVTGPLDFPLGHLRRWSAGQRARHILCT